VNALTHTTNDLPKAVFVPHNVTLSYHGDVAIVTSSVDIVNISASGLLNKKRKNKSIQDLLSSPFFATNIFVRPSGSDSYFLTTHIGSPQVDSESKLGKALRSTYSDPSRAQPLGMGGIGMGRGLGRTLDIQQLLGGKLGKGAVVRLVGPDIFKKQLGSDDDEDDDEEEDDDDDDDDDDDEDEENDDAADVGDYDKYGEDAELFRQADKRERRDAERRAQARSVVAKLLDKLGLPLPSNLKNGKDGATNNLVVLSNAAGNNKKGSAGSKVAEELVKALRANMLKTGGLPKSGSFLITEDEDGKMSVESGNLEDEMTNKSGSSGSSESSNKSNSKKGGLRLAVGSSDDDEEEDDEDDEDDDLEDDADRVARDLASQSLACIRWLHEEGRLSLSEKRVLTSDVISNNAQSRFSKVEVAYSLIIGPGKPEELLSFTPDAISSSRGSGRGDRRKKGGVSAVHYDDEDDDDEDDDDDIDDDDDDDDDESSDSTNYSRSVVDKKRAKGNLKVSLAAGESEGLVRLDLTQVDEDDMAEFEDVCREIAADLRSRK
jgi:hypothetical protein